jgi:hypothetical protein
MRALRPRFAGWLALAMLLISLFSWSNTVLSNSPELFEWRAREGRAPSAVLPAKIFMIEPANTGLFGLLKSPSIEHAASEPVWVTLTLTDKAGTVLEPRRQIKIKLIKSELGTQREGDHVLLDMIDSKTCVGVRAGTSSK